MKANNKKVINRLNRIRGQIDGVLKMVKEDRYCLDISTQLMAISSSVNSLNREVLTSHLKSCIKDSLVIKDEESIESKIKEMEWIINKIGK